MKTKPLTLAEVLKTVIPKPPAEPVKIPLKFPVGHTPRRLARPPAL